MILKSKRLLSLCIAGMLSLTTIPVLAVDNEGEVIRLAGENRIETSIKVAEEFYKNNSLNINKAILAPAPDKNLVDSLTVAPLAYELKAPILLNDLKDKVNSEVLKELKSRNVKKVYIPTGESNISRKVELELLLNGILTVRLGGGDRYETALNILEEYKSLNGDCKNVCLVSGSAIPDALSIAPIASKNSMPIILAEDRYNISSQLKSVTYDAEKVYAIGGETLLSESLIKSLKAERIFGKDRYETNGEVIKKFYSSDLESIYIANGNNNHLVDSLTASVLAGDTNGPIVLTNNEITEKTLNVLQEKVTDKTKIIALGGEKFVSDELIKSIKSKKTPNTDSEDVKWAKENLTLGNLSNVTDNLNLPIKGEKDVSIKWSSSNNVVISSEGKVRRPILKDTTVKLTATLSKGEISDIKEFYATVKKKSITGDETVVVNSQEEYKAALKTALEKFDNNLVLKISNYDDNDYNLKKINEVLIENPDINYGYTGAEASISGGTNSSERILNINFKYSLDKETMDMEKAAVKVKVNEIIKNIIIDDMSSAEKELAIHDYIVENAEYDVENYEQGIYVPEDHNSYGVLIDGIGVCESYAKAMYELLTAVGIECKYVTGNLEGNVGHAWNMVKLDDGQWYNVDATWDDPTYTNSSDRMLKVSHRYFNLNDAKFNEDHIRGEYEQSFPAANGTKYSAENMNVLETDINGNEFVRVYSKEELDEVIKNSLLNKDDVLNLNISQLGMTVNEVSQQVFEVVKKYNVDLKGYTLRVLEEEYVSYKYQW
ncbi:cell wall-binding repeat-containing protein [Clostridium senegalense]|uniref:cell wall-binding repeat-containing protein n=1 Tax=Clostridium senegalense TaxID=1465809 RepID=UPI0002893079|nr:cell wall-binding repeat-containing protein [Clostridium senegalense]